MCQSGRFLVLSHLSVSVTPGQAGAPSPGLSNPAVTSKASGNGFTSLLDALHAIESAATGNIAGAVQALTQKPETTAAVTPGLVHLDADPASTTLASAETTAVTAAKAVAADTSASATNLLDAVRKLIPGAANADADGSVSVPLAATATPDPVIAPDPAATSDAGTPPRLLKTLVAALSDLQKAEQSGKPIDKDLLKRVKDAIDALSNFLAAQQTPPVQAAQVADASPANSGTDAGAGIAAAVPTILAPPQPDLPVAAPVSGEVEADAASLPLNGKEADTLKAARTELGSFADKLEKVSASLTKDQPDLAARLETLAKSLNPKTMSAAMVGALGLDAGSGAADPKLVAAINGFVNGEAEAPVTLQPELAKPALKLPDGGILATKGDKPKTTGIAHAAPPDVAPSKAVSPAPASATSDAAPKQGTDDNPAPAIVTAAVRQADKAATEDAPSAPALTTAPATAIPPTVPGSTAVHAGLREMQQAYQAATPLPVNLPQMAYEIVRHAQQGSSHFQIRLDPADMGRVDVSLAIDKSGTVNAHLTVERSETLDLLKRDSGALGQALAQAGLDAGKTSLQFSLSQNPFSRQQGGNGQTPSASYPASADANDQAALITTPTLYRGTATASGLNIFV